MKRGITMSLLAIAVAIMIIVATTASVVGVKSINSAKFEDYKSKLKKVSDITLEYITTNKVVPTTGEIIGIENLDEDLKTLLANNADDTNKLYVIDLNLLDIGADVDIGRGTVDNGDVFVVSQNSNNVYYLNGMKYKGINYYEM